MAGFTVKVDVSALERIGNRLDNISAATLGVATRRAVNETADSIYELARPRMIEGINLTDQYVKSRMEVKHATAGGRAEAVIRATGTKPNLTQLRNYGAQQQIKRVNHTNASILAAGKSFGKWPGWTKRTGDAARGIPADEKQAGVSVEVARGSRKLIEHGFLIQLKNGNGMGVATRGVGAQGKSNYKVRYGPSVYQLFRHVATGLLDEARDQLETNVVAYATELLEKELR